MNSVGSILIPLFYGISLRSVPIKSCVPEGLKFISPGGGMRIRRKSLLFSHPPRNGLLVQNIIQLKFKRKNYFWFFWLILDSFILCTIEVIHPLFVNKFH